VEDERTRGGGKKREEERKSGKGRGGVEGKWHEEAEEEGRKGTRRGGREEGRDLLSLLLFPSGTVERIHPFDCFFSFCIPHASLFKAIFKRVSLF